MIETSFCALVGLFLTNLNHYFNVRINTNAFSLFKVTLKIGDTAHLRQKQNVSYKLETDICGGKKISMYSFSGFVFVLWGKLL